jgi:hypothetical protein
MSTVARLSLSSAGLLTALSLAAFAPAANADEGFYERNGADRAAAGISNGNQFVPSPAPTASGWDTSDVVIASLAGALIAGGGVGTAVVLRRRHPLAHPSV